MADITPAPPVNPLLTQPAAGQPLLPTAPLPVRLVDLPAALQAIQQQINLTGVLQLVDANQLALNTTLGQILFSLPQLRNNPQLLQQLLPFIESGKNAQLHIAPSADGVLHGSLSLAVTAPTALPTISQQAPTPGSLIGKQITALLLPPNAAAMPSVPSPFATPAAGTGAALLPKTVQQLLQILSSAAPTQTQRTPQTAAQNPPLPDQGLSLQVRIQQIIPPGQTPPNPAVDEFIATITGFSAALQQPIATAGHMSMLLKTGSNLPVGSMLVLKLPPAAPAEIAETPDGGGQNFPALQQLLIHAHNSDATPLQNLLQNRIPQMNQALGGALLFMLSAFNRGEVRQWLGNSAIDALERTEKKNLIAALQDELRASTATASDPVVGQWRVYHLPYQTPEQLAQLQIYVHHDGGNQDSTPAGKASRKTRFIIDITFTRLGAMQFDGFVQQKKFDLMLRSAQTLDAALRHELRYAFADALGAVGYTGQLLFQQGSQGWMRFQQGQQEVLRV